MPEININSRFISLQREATEIKLLIITEKEKHSQSLTAQPIIVTADKFSNIELQNKYLIFQMRAEEIRHILNHEINRSVSKIKCQILNQRLQKIESELELLKCPPV